MTRTVKNIVMAFTLLCAIFLVIFVVELILVNRDTGEDYNGSAIFNGQAVTNGAENGEEPNGPDELGEPAAIGLGDELIIIPGEGTRFEIEMLDTGLTLVLYVDEGVFDFRPEDGEVERYWWFYYRADDSITDRVALEVAIDFITPPDGIDGLASRFLDGYLEGADSIVRGERDIRNSSLRGVEVAGEREDGRIYEAWIHRLVERSAHELAVVFVIRYDTDEQRDALYSILDTLYMISDHEPEYDEEEYNGNGE